MHYLWNIRQRKETLIFFVMDDKEYNINLSDLRFLVYFLMCATRLVFTSTPIMCAILKNTAMARITPNGLGLLLLCDLVHRCSFVVEQWAQRVCHRSPRKQSQTSLYPELFSRTSGLYTAEVCKAWPLLPCWTRHPFRTLPIYLPSVFPPLSMNKISRL